MKRNGIAVICALILNACATTQPAQKPRLLVTIESNRSDITPADTVTLTFRAKNIGEVPLELVDHIKRQGVVTANLGAGEWGLMSADYLFVPGGPVSARNLKGFRLEPGQEHVIQSEFTLRLDGYTFPEGIYFADALLWDQMHTRSIDAKIIPAILSFKHAR